jgi:hypothetical protein
MESRQGGCCGTPCPIPRKESWISWFHLTAEPGAILHLARPQGQVVCPAATPLGGLKMFAPRLQNRWEG